LKKKRCFK